MLNFFPFPAPHLESINCQDVFAVGDICAIENHPRPKAGVFAVRGAKILKSVELSSGLVQ
jgi:NADH dehydrogenase FAD-containing subunit